MKHKMRFPSLNTQILLAALIGGLLGLAFQILGNTHAVTSGGLFICNLIGTLFINLLKMVLIPLVFCSIVVGIANLQAHHQAQRIWQYTLLFFITSMALAMLLAFGANSLFQPGAGQTLDMLMYSAQMPEIKVLSPAEFAQDFVHGLFLNPFAALSQGKVLPVVVFALFVGVALVLGGEQFAQTNRVLREVLALMQRITGWIMWLAPLGIAGLLAKLVGTQDIGVLGTLGKFMLVVSATTLVHGVILLPLVLFLVTGKSPLWFWHGAREALLTAFATSSSTATMPVTLRCTEQHLHVRRDISGFVIPLGATLNMDGTALYEAAAALFIAQLSGVDLSTSQQLVVFFTAMIAAMGAPGIPSAGMVTMVMVLQSVGLPAESIAVLLPVDRILDTLRTTVNVEGDMIGSLLVQRFLRTSDPSDD